MGTGSIAAIISIVIATSVILFNKYSKKRIIDNQYRQYTEDDSTVLMEEEDSDDETVLMDDDEDPTLLGRKITLVSDGGKEYSGYCITQLTVGRKKECDIQILGDQAVSGIHCILIYGTNGKISIRDNSSANGTYLNGQRITTETEVVSGDYIRLGRCNYQIQVL